MPHRFMLGAVALGWVGADQLDERLGALADHYRTLVKAKR